MLSFQICAHDVLFYLVEESSEFSLTEQKPKAWKSDLLTSDFTAYKEHKL